MVKYKLTKTYPGSPELGTIVYSVIINNKINHYQNDELILAFKLNQIENNSEYWQEVKELSLLEEAKLRYPIGTKFKSFQYDSGVKISNNNIYERTYMHLPIIYCDGTTMYYNNKWAEIIDDFVLPENWYIKVTDNNKEVLQQYIHNINGLTIITLSNINYIAYSKWLNGINQTENKLGYGLISNLKLNPLPNTYRTVTYYNGVEITFEQFKKYVLKEKETVFITDSHSDMLKLQSKGVNSVVLPPQKVVEKDYEILEVITNNGKFIEKVYNQDATIEPYWKIYSIRRKKDGEIFTIGDKVFSEYVNYTINKIGIVNDKCMVSALYDINNPNGSRLHYNLNNIKKLKQPLFTTEDGVDIFEGDEYYPVCEYFNLHNKCQYPSGHKMFKLFSTKEKAEEYILYNKPCLSLSDVWDNLKIKDQKEVLKFVKSKLNK